MHIVFIASTVAGVTCKRTQDLRLDNHREPLRFLKILFLSLCSCSRVTQRHCLLAVKSSTAIADMAQHRTVEGVNSRAEESWYHSLAMRGTPHLLLLQPQMRIRPLS